MSEGEQASAAGSRVVTASIVAAPLPTVERTRRAAQIVLGLLFILGIVGLLYWGREALPPFLIGLVVAYMLLPLVRRLERALPRGRVWQKVRRPLAAIAVFVLALALISLLLRALAEPVIEQTAQILGSLEELWNEAQANAPGIRDWYAQNVPATARVWIDDGFQTLGRTLLSLGGSVGRWVVGFTSSALGSIFAFIAAPLFVIYFLIDEPKLSRQIRDQFPTAWAGDTLALVHIFNRVFGSYTRGVIIESIIVGIITGLGYFLIGVEVWLPLGVIALIGEIVPIVGPWIAFFISLPVILAVGGAIAGAMGVILALPAAALLRDIAFYTSYRASGHSPMAALGRLPSFQREGARPPPQPDGSAPAATA